MKRFALFFSLLLIATPIFAAGRFFDLTGWATWVKPQSSDTFNPAAPNQPFNINFQGKLGYGGGVNFYFGETLSLAVDVSEVKPDARYGFPGATLNQGSLRMVPITGIVQWHFLSHGLIDPYLGAGAAYVLFHDISGVRDAGRVGVSQINFKDDAGLALDGGIGISLSPRIGFTGDVKYVPLKSSATAVFTSGPNQSQKIKINPVMASVGLTFHF